MRYEVVWDEEAHWGHHVVGPMDVATDPFWREHVSTLIAHECVIFGVVIKQSTVTDERVGNECVATEKVLNWGTNGGLLN